MDFSGTDNDTHLMMSYAASSGVVKTLFNDGSPKLLSNFFEKAFAASKKLRGTTPQPYRILDSFFTTLRTEDLIHSLLKDLLNMASPEAPVQILLANPFGDFARTRASAILEYEVDPVRELTDGLSCIWDVLVQNFGKPFLQNKGKKLTFQDMLDKINANKESTHLEVRLYSAAPSGPMFIFPPFLLYGRFCAHENSNALPWNLIIQDPNHAKKKPNEDLFNICQSEFLSIWDKPDLTLQENIKYVDIVFICALAKTEKPWVKNVLGRDIQWKRLPGLPWDVANVMFTDEHKQIKVAVGSQTDMGMTSAAVLTCDAIQRFSPKLIIMCGVCAAIEGKASLGDIVVAKEVFDYGSGKFENGRLSPDYVPLHLESDLIQICDSISGDGTFLRKIEDGYYGGDSHKPATKLKIVIGPMASGAAVIADERFLAGTVSYKRTLTGIDMEAYGVMKAVHELGRGKVKGIVIKGVQDYADDTKNDNFREYAAYVSAAVAREIVTRYLSLS